MLTSVIAWLKSLFAATRQSPFPAGTGPARLIVLRHAEKTGKKSDQGLSRQGTARARQLADYIPQTFGRPHFLIAARTSERSRRPVETLEPLAAALELPIDADIDDAKINRLIKTLREDARYHGKVGVVSWRHSDLSRLVEALGAPAATTPSKWDGNDYSTIIDITFSDTGAPTARAVKMPF